MSTSLPQTTAQWTVEGESKQGFDSLTFHKSVPIKPLGDRDVLVQIDAVSLNYRDLVIPKGQYPFPLTKGAVACSDGAGRVLATGTLATRFKPGDRVITLFNQDHLGGSLDPHSLATGLGGSVDGTLRRYAAFPETGLALAPANTSQLEASSLCCAGLTAWNALYGLRAVKAGDWVLTEGTGGVSLFAVQFAKAAGARVIATTSSPDKAKILHDLGADHVINYKETPAWGAEAKKLSNGHGANHIVEVAGPKSMRQSLDAVAIDGIISIIGFVGGAADEKEPSFLEALSKICTVRGILVGSRPQLEELVAAVEANEALKPVIDRKVFKGIESAKDAYEYMWDQKHQGNVCIDLSP